MSAEHKRPLFAFVLVTLACALVMGHAIRSDALSRTFRVAIPAVIAAGVHLVPDTTEPARAGFEPPAQAAPQPRAESSPPSQSARAPRAQAAPAHRPRNRGTSGPSGGLALVVPPRAPQGSTPAPVAPSNVVPEQTAGSPSPVRDLGRDRSSSPQPGVGYGSHGDDTWSSGPSYGDRGRGHGRSSYGHDGYGSNGYDAGGYSSNGYADDRGRGYGYHHDDSGRPDRGRGYGPDSSGWPGRGVGHPSSHGSSHGFGFGRGRHHR